MPHTDPIPDDPDDALAEALADAALELARRDRVHLLRMCRAAGLVDEDTPRHQVARVLGISLKHLQRIERRATLKSRFRASHLLDHIAP
jgi:DNA-directed RNA polymerase specialized sigma subunit